MRVMTSYFGNRIVRHVASDMRRLARNGFTAVLHTFSEFDLAFHRGTLREIVAATHEAGLRAEVNPWGVGKVFGGEPFSNFAAQHFFDACQVLDDDRPGPYACPNSPLFRAFMHEWIEAAVEAGVDGLFWDEPHFHHPGFLGGRPGRWGCRCGHCRALFEQRHGHPMPIEETDEVKAFKARSLVEFVEELTRKTAEAGRANTVYLPAHISSAEVDEHWKPYARLAEVSVLATGPYWSWFKRPIEIVTEYSDALMSLCRATGREPQIWIQCCKLPRGREPEIAEAVERALAAGIRNLAVWGFEGCGHETWIACEDPPRAWKCAVNALRRAAKSHPIPTGKDRP